MWFGCGWYQNTFGPQTERPDYPCQNLPLITYCAMQALFFCPQTGDLRLDAQRMDNPVNGVLCCPP